MMDKNNPLRKVHVTVDFNVITQIPRNQYKNLGKDLDIPSRIRSALNSVQLRKTDMKIKVREENIDFKYELDETVIPIISPFFGQKGQKQLFVCQIKNRFKREERNIYTVHCLGDMGFRDMDEEWLSTPIDLFKKEE